MTQRDELEQRDRFGDKLRDAEKAHEDKFFADLDKKLVAKLKERQRGAGAGELTCPSCNQDLRATDFQGARAQECPSCGGMWLEKKEADGLKRHRSVKGLLARLFGSSD